MERLHSMQSIAENNTGKDAILYIYNKCVQISLNTYINKKSLILKIKKNHKAQNQFAQACARDELRQQQLARNNTRNILEDGRNYMPPILVPPSAKRISTQMLISAK